MSESLEIPPLPTTPEGIIAQEQEEERKQTLADAREVRARQKEQEESKY